MSRKKLKICFCSDFFYPSVGGIETHILELSNHLISFGHKVIVITRNRGKKYKNEIILFNKLKVYFLKRCTLGVGSSVTTFWFSVPQLYNIFVKEKITHVHCHQATSSIGFEAGVIAQIMGLKVFFTEHSLLSLSVVGALHLNLSISPFLHCCDQIIAVTNLQKQNLQARVGVSANITVIPNGVDTTVFKPRNEAAPNYPTIIAVTRFEKRRGSDMIKIIVQNVCSGNNESRWVIAGDGSMFSEMKNYVESSPYKSRIELLGNVSHDKIASVLQRGHFFMNCSLTDAFCISNVEAAACGLYVISTDTGGIPEVLPDQLRTLVPPCPKMISDAILRAIAEKKSTGENSHKIISKMFSWESVAERVQEAYYMEERKENVFKTISKTPGPYVATLGLIYYSLVFMFMKLVELINHFLC